MTDTATDRPNIPPDLLVARRPTGAPHALDRIVAYNQGVPVTAEERILAAIRVPLFQHEAADAAGIQRTTLAQWKTLGAAANRKKAEGKRLTATEQRFAAFVDAMLIAEGEGRSRILGTMVKLGVGGYDVETVTVKLDKDGDELERTVRTSKAEPNQAALAWFAERRWAEDWNRRQQIEVSGPEGGPIKIESPLSSLMSTLDAMERRQHSIDTQSRELAPTDDAEADDDGS